MNNERNRRIYDFYAPLYDLLFKPFTHRARLQAIQMLDLQPGERLLIPGIGTGLDLPHVPPGVSVTGIDLSPASLTRARAKAGGRDVALPQMDAQHLSFPDASYDAVLFSLFLSVVPDPAMALREAWRVLVPGGRAVVFDKFLPENRDLTRGRYILGRIIAALGTDPNRRFSSMISGIPGLSVKRNEPSLLGGQYRILRMEKA